LIKLEVKGFVVNWKEEKKKLEQIIEAQHAIILELRAEIAELKAIILQRDERIVELERRLGLNSNNSGKPPSSDGLQKPARVQSLREKSDKKSGGQPGHKGSTLAQVKNPDVIEYHEAICCPHCNTNLTDAPIINTCKRQVFEIPEIKKAIVTEHQFQVKCCPGCHKKVMAPKAETIKAPVQYSSRVKAVLAYLSIHNLLPINRITEIMRDLFGVPISEAIVEKAPKECATTVKPVVAQIEKYLKEVDVKGEDESGFRIGGKTLWLQTLCNDKAVHYRASEKRGDITTDIKGIVVHDHFAPYYSKLKNVEHALCNAHHLRELKAAKEIDKEPWARDMMRLLLFGLRVSNEKPEDITSQWLIRYRKLYDKIISKGLVSHEKLGALKEPTRGRIKRRPGHNLLLRLQRRADDVLRFSTNLNVPFTNNLSEQSLRMIKVKQKVSGCFRTFDGATDFLTVRSYTGTAQKRDFSIIDSLIQAFRGTPINLAPT
jgi:transposase